MDARITNDKAEVLRLRDEGYEPVECSIGGDSIVGPLVMDHHGERSHLEGVALRAYRDLFGARREDPRFVVVGTADADAAFACAALAGVLPHPSRADELADAPPPVRAAGTQDLTALAELVNRVDTDPVGLDLAEEPWGPALLAFNALNVDNRDSLGLTGAVALWRHLTSGHPGLATILEAARSSESLRRQRAAEDLSECKVAGGWSPRVLALRGTRSWGFDVWYGRRQEVTNPSEPAAWDHPVVLALVEASGSITLGCPNKAVAEALFGAGGLRNVFPLLDDEEGKGWGGREAIGGSPRGIRMTPPQLERVARVVASEASSQL